MTSTPRSDDHGHEVRTPAGLSCKRDLFSLPRDTHYLNCAYMSPLSKRVVDAGMRGIERKTTPFEVRAPDFFVEVDRLRERFARLVNVHDSSRIAVIPAASYGLAQAARNTPIERGQNIVIVREQFPSNVYIWRRRAEETGAHVKVIGSPTDGCSRAAAWNDAILDAIDADTAAVATGCVHWTDGMRFDLDAISQRAHEQGAALILDGTQLVGAAPFDVQRVQPDALICAGYKWLMAPYSIGAAYYGPYYDQGAPLEESWMAREGSEDFAGLVSYNDRYRGGAVRYDVGESSNFILIPMFIAALEQLLEWDPVNIQTYGYALTLDLIEDLRNRGFLVTEDGWRGGHLFGVRLPPDVNLTALQARLQEHQVYVSLRGSAIRVSVHVYNDATDVEALGQALLG